MANQKTGVIDSPFAAAPLATANVTLRQLRAFVALAQTRSFTAAAKQVHITQSALSALVRELEDEVGSRLFDRTTRSVTPTGAGLELLPVAQRVLHDLNGGLAVVRDLSLKRRGCFTVAVTPMLAASFIPSLCAAFGRQFPNLRMVVRDRLAADNINSVRTGEADLAIGNFGPVSEDISLTLVEGSRVGLVIACGHRFSRLRGVKWAELASEPLILLSKESAFRQVVEQALLRAGVMQAPAYDVAYMGTAIGLAQAGLGVAICPSHVAQTLDRAQAHFVPVCGPAVTEGVYIATLKGRSLSPAAQAFVEFTLAGSPWAALKNSKSSA
jgi:DNA-binding transcriptional LysR family regulator